jgi:hypothetical protein
MKIIDNHEWNSHQPLIKAVMDLYKPQFVLELGIGENSTPIFMSYNVNHLCVESNKEWIGHIKSKYENLNVIYHNLEDIQIGTHLNEITEEQKLDISDFYDNINLPDLNPRLLFVDQYTACRTISINTLRDKFDLIIYHDCQPDGIEFYNYDLINDTGFVRYFLKTPISWTGLLVKEINDKGFGALNDIIYPHIKEYKKKYTFLDNIPLTNTY